MTELTCKYIKNYWITHFLMGELHDMLYFNKVIKMFKCNKSINPSKALF